MPQPPQPQPYELTASQCRAELDEEKDLARLRALVGVRRVMLEMATSHATGTIEGHAQDGYVKTWRFPRSVQVICR